MLRLFKRLLGGGRQTSSAPSPPSSPPEGVSRETVRALIERNELPHAVACLDKILEQSPEDAEALALRGVLHGRLGDIRSSLADLGRSVELDPNHPEVHFNYAVSHLRAGDAGEALAELSRVLQMTPDNARAQAQREKLASELGLAELDQGARVMERFTYSQCGPGYRWKVGLREMYKFQPHLPPSTYRAALLDLCQTPQAFVELTVTPVEYTVRLLTETRLPGISRTTVSEVITETIAARPDLLLGVLNRFLARGLLVRVDNALRFHTQ